MNKYHAVKTTIDGITFDSKKEAHRYGELKALEKAGFITELKLQVPFLIVPKVGRNRRARFYYADFTYREGGVNVIEDVKSPVTRKNAVYSLKKALVLSLYEGYEFREV